VVWSGIVDAGRWRVEVALLDVICWVVLMMVINSVISFNDVEMSLLRFRRAPVCP
jgi:hypothetical protein